MSSAYNTLRNVLLFLFIAGLRLRQPCNCPRGTTGSAIVPPVAVGTLASAPFRDAILASPVRLDRVVGVSSRGVGLPASLVALQDSAPSQLEVFAQAAECGRG